MNAAPLIERLAEYEDIGLEPYHVREMAKDVAESVKQLGSDKHAVIMATRKLQNYIDTGLTPEQIQKLKCSVCLNFDGCHELQCCQFRKKGGDD
jgi:hypothetical protein